MAFMTVSPQQKVNDDSGGYGCSRKRPSRTQSTPYDRLPTAFRSPPTDAATGGWVAWLVRPAKRLIGSGFSFLSKQSYPAPSLPQQPQPEDTIHSDKYEVVAEVVATPVEIAQAYMRSNLAVKIPPKRSTRVAVPTRRPFSMIHPTTDEDFLTKRAQRRMSSGIDIHTSRIRRIRQKYPIYPSSGAVPIRRGGSSSGSVTRYPPAAKKSVFIGQSSKDSDCNGQQGSEQAQKRRSSVINIDLSYPRRIRPKYNVLPASQAPPIQGRGLSSVLATPYSPAAEKSPFVEKRQSSKDSDSNGQQGSVLAQKRRSSVIDIDLSYPRRIRPKYSVLPSSGALPIQGCGLSSVFNHVPSKSSEIVSIRRHLDDMVTKLQKPPSKLSPSMLNGRARRSLKDIDSLMFMENDQDNMLSIKDDAILPGAHENILHKQEEGSENGPSKSVALFDKSALDSSGVDKNSLTIDTAPVIESNPFKKHGFRMSAPEDYP